MKKLPPYARTLFDLIQRGGKPSNSINVFVGFYAWKKGQAFSVSYPDFTIALPPWHSAFQYYWPVSGYDVCLINTGGAEDEYLEETAFVLLQHQSTKVIIVNDGVTIYRKES